MRHGTKSGAKSKDDWAKEDIRPKALLRQRAASRILLGTEAAGAHLLKDLDDSCHEKEFPDMSQGVHVMNRIDPALRRTWRDMFDPVVSKFAHENFAALRSAFVRFGDLLVKEPDDAEVIANETGTGAMTFTELLNVTPRDDKTLPYFYIPGSFNDLMSLLMNRDESYLTIAVMNGGFAYASKVEAALRSGGKSAGFAFVGYGWYPHRDHIYSFRNGGTMKKKLFVAEKDMELLRQNSSTPMLVVDDALVTGRAMKRVDKMLREMGANEIYKIEEVSRFLHEGNILYL